MPNLSMLSKIAKRSKQGISEGAQAERKIFSNVGGEISYGDFNEIHGGGVDVDSIHSANRAAHKTQFHSDIRNSLAEQREANRITAENNVYNSETHNKISAVRQRHSDKIASEAAAQKAAEQQAKEAKRQGVLNRLNSARDNGLNAPPEPAPPIQSTAPAPAPDPYHQEVHNRLQSVFNKRKEKAAAEQEAMHQGVRDKLNASKESRKWNEHLDDLSNKNTPDAENIVGTPGESARDYLKSRGYGIREGVNHKHEAPGARSGIGNKLRSAFSTAKERMLAGNEEETNEGFKSVADNYNRKRGLTSPIQPHKSTAGAEAASDPASTLFGDTGSEGSRPEQYHRQRIKNNYNNFMADLEEARGSGKEEDITTVYEKNGIKGYAGAEDKNSLAEEHFKQQMSEDPDFRDKMMGYHVPHIAAATAAVGGVSALALSNSRGQKSNEELYGGASV